MPTQFGEEFDPRSAIPLSDAELARLAMEAQVDTVQPNADSMLLAVFADFALWGVLLYFASRSISGDPIVAFFLAIGLSLTVLWLLFVNKQVLGPVSYIVKRKARTAVKLDLSSTATLSRIVDHIVAAPLRHSRELQLRVEADRHAIHQSLQELQQIETSLRDELASAEEESVQMLLQSRRESAQAAILKLRLLDSELGQQVQQALEAVRPVLEMKQKFERLRNLGDSLRRIQSAHGLADEAAGRAAETRLELQLLQAKVTAAQAKLYEISRIVEAQELARHELGV